jgi:gluconokinase
MTAPPTRVLLLMGVSGSGKTTLGQRLAADLGWAFYDGDDFHPPANVAKMQAGLPLDDADRHPWLLALRARIEASLGQGEPAVVACSALRQAYRHLLLHGLAGVRLVYLKGTFPLIAARMQARKGHFMRVGMLQSQFDTLEEPTDAYVADIALPPEQLVATIRQAFHLT